MRSTRALLAALAAAGIAVAACSSGATPARSEVPVATNLLAATVKPDAATLTDGTWNLAEFSPDSAIKIGGDLSPTINFSADGKATYTAR